MYAGCCGFAKAVGEKIMVILIKALVPHARRFLNALKIFLSFFLFFLVHQPEKRAVYKKGVFHTHTPGLNLWALFFFLIQAPLCAKIWMYVDVRLDLAPQTQDNRGPSCPFSLQQSSSLWVR